MLWMVPPLWCFWNESSLKERRGARDGFTISTPVWAACVHEVRVALASLRRRRGMLLCCVSAGVRHGLACVGSLWLHSGVGSPVVDGMSTGRWPHFISTDPPCSTLMPACMAVYCGHAFLGKISLSSLQWGWSRSHVPFSGWRSTKRFAHCFIVLATLLSRWPGKPWGPRARGVSVRHFLTLTR